MPEYITRKIALPRQVTGQEIITNDFGEIIFAEPVVLVTKNGEVFTLEESFPSPVQCSPNIYRTSGSGSIPAGSKSISIANLGPGEGIIKSVSVPPGVYSWSTTGLDTLTSLSYNATGTVFIITTVDGAN